MSTVVRLLGSRVRIPLCFCVGSVLRYELIALLGESCQVCVCDLETFTMRRPGPDLGCYAWERWLRYVNVDAINNKIDRLIGRYKCLGGICCLPLQGRCMNMKKN
jgi:hypothetical protein